MIDILMATYNGKNYIEAQLDSILGQSNNNWHLIIRDDCSSDGTWAVLNDYKINYPDKIDIIRAEKPSGSAKENFFQLLELSRNEYIMFSDQDDVWMHDKIENTYRAMIDLEGKFGTDKPLLIHTDVCVVNENLEIIKDSIFEMQNMNPNNTNLNKLITTNIVTGCTMMINRITLEYLKQKPRNAVMHDMWLALIASAFGKIGFLEYPTMLYRQHSSNANGAKNAHSLSHLLWKIKASNEIHSNLEKYYNQAGEFGMIFKNQLQPHQFQMLNCYSQFERMSCLSRWKVLNKYDLKKDGVLKVLGQIVR